MDVLRWLDGFRKDEQLKAVEVLDALIAGYLTQSRNSREPMKEGTAEVLCGSKLLILSTGSTPLGRR